MVASELRPQPQPLPEKEVFLTRAETARELHVAMMTLRSFEQRGILIPYRVGRRVLYSRKEI